MNSFYSPKLPIGLFFLLFLITNCEWDRDFDHPCDITLKEINRPSFKTLNTISFELMPKAIASPYLSVSYEFENGKLGSLQTETAHGIKYWQVDGIGEPEIFQTDFTQGILGKTNCENCTTEIPGSDFPKIGIYEFQAVASHCTEDVVSNQCNTCVQFIGPLFSSQVIPKEKPGAGKTITYTLDLSNDGIKNAENLKIQITNLSEDLITFPSGNPIVLTIDELLPGQNNDDKLFEVQFATSITDQDMPMVQLDYFYGPDPTPSMTRSEDTESKNLMAEEAVLLSETEWECSAIGELPNSLDDPRIFLIGDTVTATLNLKNDGALNAENIRVTMDNPGINIIEAPVISVISNSDPTEYPITFVLADTFSLGKQTIDINIMSNDSLVTPDQICFFSYPRFVPVIAHEYPNGNNNCINFPCEIQFNLNVTESSNPASIINFEWTIDGASYFDSDPIHTFNQSKYIEVTFRAEGYGLTKEFSKSIFVTPLTLINRFSVSGGLEDSGLAFHINGSDNSYEVASGSGPASGSGEFEIVSISFDPADGDLQFIRKSANDDFKLAGTTGICATDDSYYTVSLSDGAAYHYDPATASLIKRSSPAIFITFPSDILCTYVDDMERLLVTGISPSSFGGPYVKLLDNNFNLVGSSFSFGGGTEWKPKGAAKTIVMEESTNKLATFYHNASNNNFNVKFLQLTNDTLNDVGGFTDNSNFFDDFSNAIKMGDKIIMVGSTATNNTKYGCFSFNINGTNNNDYTVPPQTELTLNINQTERIILKPIDETYFALACASSTGGVSQVYLAKINSNNYNVEWDEFLNFPREENVNCIPKDLMVTEYGGFAVVGYTKSIANPAEKLKMLFILTDPFGRVL